MYVSQNNRISYNCHVFYGLSVLLAQLLKDSKLVCVWRCYVCQNLAPFCTLSFHFHFAADFVTLSHTKITLSVPYLLVYCNIKKGPPSGRSLPV